MQLNPDALCETGEWLARAERDLQAAKNELSVSVPLPEISAYHAEKALKAFLTLRSTPFPHTHDLVQLEGLCEAADEAFARFLVTAQTLSPYATLFRYPGGPLAPSLAEAEQATELADDLVRFVRHRFLRSP